MTDRLTKSDWVRHGLLTLAKQGPAGLKVGPMAEGLNVSRGSFYWHFADVAALRAELLRAWQEEQTDRIIRTLSERAEPDRLSWLLQGAFNEDRRLDRAMRAWAAQDDEVTDTVTSVDARRIAYIGSLLVDAGVDPAKAAPRATFLYWAYLGQAAAMDPRHTAIDGAAVDDIAALFERT